MEGVSIKPRFSRILLACTLGALGMALAFFAADAQGNGAETIAGWTFEASGPTLAETLETGVAPEIGEGMASGSHVSDAVVYSSPTGNGSAEAASANHWALGDYWQFSLSTVGFKEISVSWDQVSSSTGPGYFQLMYSVNGKAFTSLDGRSLYVNDVGTYPWGATPKTETSYGVDFSSITEINNAASLTFRLVASSTISASGGTVRTTGASRVDNFFVTGAILSGKSLTWQGGSIWDGGTSNWNDGNGASRFSAVDEVTFGDAGVGRVTIDGSDAGHGVSPALTRVVNTSGTYELTGGPVLRGPLVKSGSGTLVLSASNHFSSVSVSEGRVIVTEDAQLGPGELTLDHGGTLVIGGGMISTRALTTGSSGGVIDTRAAGNVWSLSGPALLKGPLSVTGAGRVVFNGTTSIPGAFTLSGTGGLSLAGAVSVSGTLCTTGTVALPGGFATLGKGVLKILDGAVALSGSKDCALSNGGLFDGDLDIVENLRLLLCGPYAGRGRIRVAAPAAAPITDGTFAVPNSSIVNSDGNYATISNNIALNFNDKPFVPGSVSSGTAYVCANVVTTVGLGSTSGGLTLNGIISGNSDLNIGGPVSGGGTGYLILNAPNTYTGNTLINSGSNSHIRIGVNNALPTGTHLVFGVQKGVVNPELDLFGFHQQVASLSNGGEGIPSKFIITNNGTAASVLTVSGSVSPANPFGGLIKDGPYATLSLVKAGSNTLSLEGAMLRYSGSTAVLGGKLLVSGSLSGNSNVEVGVAGAMGVGTAATELGSLVVGGTGALVACNGTEGTKPWEIAAAKLRFENGSRLTLGLSGCTGTNSLIRFRGALELGGAELTGSLVDGFSIHEGELIFLIANDGGDPISGFFTGLPQGAQVVFGWQRFQISYTGDVLSGSFEGPLGNDLVLQAIPEPGTGALSVMALALTWAFRRERRGHRSHAAQRHSMRAFSLMETMTVTGVLALVMAVTLPMFSSLMRASGRVSAVDQLMSLFDEARSLAIAQGRPAYVVFADATADEDHRCRAAALFQEGDDPAVSPARVSAWNVLPSGMAMSCDFAVPSVFTAPPEARRPAFIPPGENIPRLLPYVKFGPTGEVLYPAASSWARVVLFAGFINDQGQMISTAGLREQVPVDQIRLSLFTGRPKYQMGD